MTKIVATYECDCGFVGLYQDHPEFDGWDGVTVHNATPLPIEGYELQCSANCEQSGCNLSDCVAWAQDEGVCPMCDAPAVVVCTNERHDTPCQQPCNACDEECHNG